MFHRPKIKINFELVSKIQFHIRIAAQLGDFSCFISDIYFRLEIRKTRLVSSFIRLKLGKT